MYKTDKNIYINIYIYIYLCMCVIFYCLPFCAEELRVLGVILEDVGVIWAFFCDSGRLLLCFSRVLGRGWLGAFSWAPVL